MDALRELFDTWDETHPKGSAYEAFAAGFARLLMHCSYCQMDCVSVPGSGWKENDIVNHIPELPSGGFV